jgi:hypothetical protein
LNSAQVQDFVLRYLEATKCHIIEKNIGSLTVKLSPEADRALTNRSYYWSFVERTGVVPETMTYTFVFNPQVEEDLVKNKSTANPAALPTLPDRPADSILGRYFGFVPAPQTMGRVLNETVTFGSRRLDQFFNAVRNKGRFVHLFEEPLQQRPQVNSSSYSSWFGVNFNVSLTCDMKRDELHSLGICLSTGEIVANFHQLLLTKSLTPKLPVHTYIRDSISLSRALIQLENHLERTIKTYDHTWAKEAETRLFEELSRIESYYQDLLSVDDPQKKTEAAAQYQNRKEEIEWQYRPRVQASVINCGLFHLL